ncbi:MAG: hypothetical protein ABI283_11710 [Rhodanobacter sp.]
MARIEFIDGQDERGGEVIDIQAGEMWMPFCLSSAWNEGGGRSRLRTHLATTGLTLLGIRPPEIS